MRVSRYGLKRILLAPSTAHRRRRLAIEDPVGRAILETHYYRRPMLDFIAATVETPDLLYDVDIDRSSIVFDVGAYVGEWSERIIERYGSRLFAFEPSPGAYRKLARRLSDHPEATPLEYGLGAADATVSLVLAGPGSAVGAQDAGFGSVGVRIRDVARVLEELEVDRVDLLKVNIEGGEYDLLDRLIETCWLPRIRLVSVQFHEWHPKAYGRRRSIRRALRSSHDEVWCYPWVWELWRRGEST